jgi:hypothetical protein
MKKIILTCVVMLTLSSLQANAFDFGNFFRFLFSLQAPVSEVEKSTVADMEKYSEEVSSSLTDITNKELELDNPTKNAFLSIISLISNANDTKNITAQINSIEKNSSISSIEKSVKINDVISEYQTTLKSNSVSVVVIMKTLSDANKTKLVNNIKVLSDNGQKYVELGRDSIKTANNLKSQTKRDDDITALNDSIDSVTGRLSNKASTVVYLANELKIIAKIAGIKF